MKKRLLLLSLFLLPVLAGCNHIHHYEPTVLPPTCTENGYKKEVCDCGAERYTTFDALGHEPFERKHVDATCTQEGLQGEIVCMRCNEVLSSEQVLPPLGHEFIDDVCIRCNQINNIWGGSIDTTWMTGEKTSYTITSASELAGLAKLVDEGNTFENITIHLGKSIYLNEYSNSTAWVYTIPENVWNPIGKNVPFKGSFQGDGHTIYGIYGENLFGLIENATVSNFTVSHSYFLGTDKVGIIGEANDSHIGYIENDHSNIRGEGRYAGGIVACMNDGDIAFCKADCSVASDYYGVGGIAGYLSGTMSDCTANCTVFAKDSKFGVLVGYLYYGTVYADDPMFIGFNQNGTILTK